MPQIPSDLLSDVRRRRAQARRVQAELAAAERERDKANRAHDRAKERLSTASIHLMRKLDRIEKYPSPRAAEELAGIARDTKVPHEARARAAAIALSWARLTSDAPEEPKQRKTPKRK